MFDAFIIIHTCNLKRASIVLVITTLGMPSKTKRKVFKTIRGWGLDCRVESIWSCGSNIERQVLSTVVAIEKGTISFYKCSDPKVSDKSEMLKFYQKMNLLNILVTASIFHILLMLSRL